ncbi:MAG: hypothetical protein ACYDGN_00450 [Acidimicrobiales bacterium]
MKRSRGHVVVILFLLPILLVACTSVRNGLGTRDGLCFSSIPAARRVVGTKPAFSGVRLQSPASLVGSIPHGKHQRLVPPAAFRPTSRAGVCLFEFTGEFSKRVVALSWRPELGSYRVAIVAIKQSDHRVLGVLLLHRSPFRFGHLS